MGINLDAAKQKLDDMQKASSAGKQNKLIWKPKPGKNVIRIVPYQFNKDWPFIELYFHYDIGKKKSMISLKSFGENDPIVNFAEKLQSNGNKEDWKLGKKLEPKIRIFAPIIVRGEEGEGVRFWGFGKQIYKELLAILNEEDYGDITDLNNGKDVTVTFTTAKEAGNDFGEIKIMVKPKDTKATEDRDVANMIVNGQTNIEEVFPRVEYAEIKAALDAWLNEGTSEDEENVPAANSVTVNDDLPFDKDVDDTPTKATRAAKSASTATSKTGTNANIDADLDELFGGKK